MALSVSTDLSVNTGPSYVEEKLEDKQKALRKSIEKGEPKIFGICQMVIGLLIISYSLPLLSVDSTMILNFGVPWWSGLMFVISGGAAIAVEKKASMKAVSVCLAVSGMALIISVIALILYYVDIASSDARECHMQSEQMCDHRYYVSHYSAGVKTTISVINLVQTGMSAAFTVILYNQRKNFMGYAAMNE